MNFIQSIILLVFVSCFPYHVVSYRLQIGKPLLAAKILPVLCNTKHSEPQSSLPSVGTSTSTLKTMVFMDGTWLYYSLVQGRTERSCPVARKFGPNWHQTHHVDWSKLPSIIAGNIREQLNKQKVHSQSMNVDITRSSVFTSLRADTEVGSLRDTMLHRFYQNNFDVHRFETKMHQEKCVDISLAVEMLYMATVPNAYDIAVIVTGDMDFMPALEKTRLLGKRTAICSFRNSINQDMLAPEARIRDFDVIWLDEYLDQLIVPITAEREKREKEIAQVLLETVVQILQRAPTGTYSSRDMGRELQSRRLHDADLLTHLKVQYRTMRAFMEKYNILFTTCADRSNSENSKAFEISLQADYMQHYDGVRDGTLPGKLSSGCHTGAMAWLSRASALRNKKGSDTSVTDTATVKSRKGTDTSVAVKSESTLVEQWQEDVTTQNMLTSAVSVDSCPAEQTDSSSVSSSTPGKKFQTSSAAAHRTKEYLAALIMQLFKEQGTDVLNSRTVGRYLQAQSADDDRWPNALAALKALFGGLLNYCEAYSKGLVVEPEVDPAVGGFNLRMLRPSELQSGSSLLSNAPILKHTEEVAAMEVIEGAAHVSVATADGDGRVLNTREEPDAAEELRGEDQWTYPHTHRPLSPRQLANTNTAVSITSSSSTASARDNRTTTAIEVSDLKVTDLKTRLKVLQLSTTGKKQDLQARLLNALENQAS